MSIWLPEKGFDKFLYKPSNYVYIQSGVSDNGNYCYCGLEKETQHLIVVTFLVTSYIKTVFW